MKHCVILQVPAAQLHQLLQRTFLRFLCLMGGTASSREWTTLPADVGAVLAYKYGCVLLEVLAGVVGAADGLHDEFAVEVQHIMGLPQVRAAGCVILYFRYKLSTVWCRNEACCLTCSMSIPE